MSSLTSNLLNHSLHFVPYADQNIHLLKSKKTALHFNPWRTILPSRVAAILSGESSTKLHQAGHVVKFLFLCLGFYLFYKVCKVGVQTTQNSWMCRSLGAQPRFPVDWHLGCISFYFYTALNPGQARTFPIISLSPLGNRESLVNNSFLRNNPKVQAELYPGSFLILSITCYLLLCPGIFVLLLIKPVSGKGNQF